jgi:hypothetical protein
VLFSSVLERGTVFHKQGLEGEGAWGQRGGNQGKRRSPALALFGAVSPTAPAE